eukprot:4146046-Prymnesium_polylepis.1
MCIRDSPTGGLLRPTAAVARRAHASACGRHAMPVVAAVCSCRCLRRNVRVVLSRRALESVDAPS